MGPVAGTSSVREQGTLVFSKTTEQWRQTLGTWTGRQGTFAVGRICGSHTSGSPHHKAQTNRRRFLSHCVLTRHMGTSCALLCRCTAYSAHSRLSVLMQRPDSPSQTQQVGRRSSAQNSRSETTEVGGMAAGKKKKEPGERSRDGDSDMYQVLRGAEKPLAFRRPAGETQCTCTACLEHCGRPESCPSWRPAWRAERPCSSPVALAACPLAPLAGGS